MFETTKRQTVKNVLPVLRGAMKLLQKKGWCQGVEHNADKDTYCALGALREVSRKQAWRAQDLMVQVHNNHAGWHQYEDITEFNDTQSRTKRQVLGLFKRTITAAQQHLKETR